jgi:hypothetical protein
MIEQSSPKVCISFSLKYRVKYFLRTVEVMQEQKTSKVMMIIELFGISAGIHVPTSRNRSHEAFLELTSSTLDLFETVLKVKMKRDRMHMLGRAHPDNSMPVFSEPPISLYLINSLKSLVCTRRITETPDTQARQLRGMDGSSDISNWKKHERFYFEDGNVVFLASFLF